MWNLLKVNYKDTRMIVNFKKKTDFTFFTDAYIVNFELVITAWIAQLTHSINRTLKGFHREN